MDCFWLKITFTDYLDYQELFQQNLLDLHHLTSFVFFEGTVSMKVVSGCIPGGSSICNFVLKTSIAAGLLRELGLLVLWPTSLVIGWFNVVDTAGSELHKCSGIHNINCLICIACIC